ncbi:MULTISPECIES: hypothetical protein [unclassified Micromonospora]|uniref:hypothetical protein n=1 Tax=unclassified Micromonospora TaxID=2617518 RepID=UPI002FF1858A
MLLNTLPEYLDDEAYAQPAMKALAAMGPHAQPVIPVLDRLIASRHRAAVYLGDVDAEMRADEQLLQLALATRAQITTTPHVTGHRGSRGPSTRTDPYNDQEEHPCAQDQT